MAVLNHLDEGVGTLAFVLSDTVENGQRMRSLNVYGHNRIPGAPQNGRIVYRAFGLHPNISLTQALELTILDRSVPTFCRY